MTAPRSLHSRGPEAAPKFPAATSILRKSIIVPRLTFRLLEVLLSCPLPGRKCCIRPLFRAGSNAFVPPPAATVLPFSRVARQTKSPPSRNTSRQATSRHLNSFSIFPRSSFVCRFMQSRKGSFHSPEGKFSSPGKFQGGSFAFVPPPRKSTVRPQGGDY